MSDIRGLSLIQPWATLMATGAKKIDTRSWQTPYRGWIAIHASKGFPGWAKRTCHEEPFESILDAAGYRLNQRLQDYGKQRFPLGAIIAVAYLHNVGEIFCRSDGAIADDALMVAGQKMPITGDELVLGDYTPGRFGWVVTNVHPLPEPISCKGALGIWTPPADVLERLEAFVNG